MRGHSGNDVETVHAGDYGADAHQPCGIDWLVEGDDTDDVSVTLEGEWYVVRDEETGVASQGKRRAEALANLAEVLELHERPVPENEDVDEELTAPWL